MPDLDDFYAFKSTAGGGGTGGGCLGSGLTCLLVIGTIVQIAGALLG